VDTIQTVVTRSLQRIVQFLTCVFSMCSYYVVYVLTIGTVVCALFLYFVFIFIRQERQHSMKRKWSNNYEKETQKNK